MQFKKAVEEYKEDHSYLHKTGIDLGYETFKNPTRKLARQQWKQDNKIFVGV